MRWTGNRVRAVPVGWGLAAALLLAPTATSAMASPAPPGAAAARSFAGTVSVSASMPAPPGLPSRTSAGPLRVPDPEAYARAKARAAAAVAVPAPAAARDTATQPTTGHSWEGIHDPAYAPSDSSSAIGTTRFVELINSDYAIYTRTGTDPAAVGTLTDITGCASTDCSEDALSDAQVIWDPGTSRFFYAANDVVDATHNYLAFGWSTSATPTASSWCRYELGFGANSPDSPKLGDSKDFELIGLNLFDSSNAYIGSGVSWISKPATGAACPAVSSLKTGTAGPFENADGTAAFAPVPANQIDSSGTGWAVARPAALAAAGDKDLTVFKVTRNAATGAAVIPTTGVGVPVAAFKVPADAPQRGSANELDTLDTRNTQAVSAVDPAHGGKVALWTQHTVLGGAGAEVRWYELDPTAHRLLQQGKLTSPSLFTFNGAVSPDRAVNGTTARYGSDMVITADTSSSTTASSLQMASKVGAGPQSAPVTVHTSAGPDIGFDCVADQATCRWGDYAAATPDPTATGSVGRVWSTSMLIYRSTNKGASNWSTWNVAITP